MAKGGRLKRACWEEAIKGATSPGATSKKAGRAGASGASNAAKNGDVKSVVILLAGDDAKAARGAGKPEVQRG